MATEKIGIEVEVKGAEKSISSFKDLKTAIKAAKDEQIAMTEKFGENSIEATKAGQKLAGLQDRVGDLNDATKSLAGSGIEKLSSSFRLLGEGIANFDFDKIKIGFGGIASAMSAIPIFLIIKGLEYLYENFDKVKALLFDTTDEVKNNKEALEALQKQQDASKKSLDDYIGSLEKELETLKLTNASIEDQVKLRQKITGVQVKSIDEQIKKQEALIEVTKKEIIQNEALLRQSQLRAAGTSSSYESEITTKNRALDNTLKNQKTELEALRAANVDKASVIAKGEDDIKKINQPAIDAANKLREKRLEDEKKLLADIEKAKEESYIKTLKSEQTQAIAKAQFQNNDLIASINSTTASQAIKNKALAQAEITLQDNILQIQKDYKVKQEAVEKAAKEKKDAQDKADELLFQTTQKGKIANYLSRLESEYQLESQRLTNQGKNLQEGSKAEEENNAKKVELQRAHLAEIYHINIANAELLGLDVTNIENKYLQDKEAAEDAARERKKAKEKKLQQDIVDSVNLAAQTTLAVSKTLSDTYYMKETQKINKLYADKLKNVKQGSKEEKAILDQKAKDEKDLARQQFETQKKFNRASAIMNGILGLGAIFAIPDPTLGIMSAIRAVALVASTAANVAQINATQFDEGGSSAGGIPAAETSAPSTAQAPSIYGPGQGQSTTFTGNQNNNFAPVKAYVVETENRSTTNRVNKLVSESTYG
jgi:hypothetical protein